ncbi:helix-turn-helix transcriptional regulator [Saccharothrix variisporea]|uniref:Helix-turn-helix protein n=1 Tax=Saccharothrix variisporea TaxID=543527 RepID=A0A495X3V5_9PSEU|nr:helix-turn-helix transcriptional regulator [Saccharothrix variisporea]RKT67313.1 helix-turn-helix protein [Saccharothrix variisporea]
MSELSEFLRSRRGRLSPEQAGLATYGTRRRVPGLRREELAQLAGISADYYIRFEQGRLDNVSDQVLDAVARALRLDDTEHAHLRTLVRPHGRAPGDRRTRPQQQWLLDSIAGPAYILGARTDVLAWNDLACALYGTDLATLDPPNMARLIFLDPTARTLWVPWEDKARDTVGGLRVLAGMYPDDLELRALVAELHDDPDFARLWTEHDVWTSPFGEKRFRHPVAGEFCLHYEAFAVPGEPDRTLITYTAEPGSPGATALSALGGRP